MAGDWIPVRKGLKDELEVMRLATLTGLSPRVVVSILIDFWGWVDSVTDDGKLKGITLDEMSRFCHDVSVTFWGALITVGWLTITSDGIEIPNFDAWLGNSAKKRLKAARRQRLNRHRDPNVTLLSRCERNKSVTTGEERTVNTNPNPKGRGKRVWTMPEDKDFAAFWSAYPRKLHLRVAWEAWQLLKPDAALAAVILAALDPQRWPARWRDDDGRWIPSPAKWLRDRRWEEVPAATPAGKTAAQRAEESARKRQQAEEDRRRAEADRPKVREQLSRLRKAATGGSPDGPEGSDGQAEAPD